MKILVNGVQLLAPLTGIGQYVRYLFTAMENMAATDVHVFYGRNFRPGVSLPSARKAQLLRQGHELLQRFLPNPRALRKALERQCFAWQARKFGKDCIYHEPNFIALPYDGPLVLSIHDLSCFDHPEMHPEERVRLMQRDLPGAIERADQIIVISQATGQALQRWFGVAPARINLTYLAADARYHPRAGVLLQATLARFGLVPGEYVLSVGTLEPRKNLPALFAAHAGLPEALRQRFPLVVAGMRGWHQAEALNASSAAMARGELRLLGYVPDAAVPDLYAGAAAFAYPSRYEGFGLPPLEAMASGVPVITSNRTSLPEVVGSAGLMVDPDDVDGLREGLRRLLEDRVFAATLGEAGRLRSRSFSWERCARETQAVYAKVLQQRGLGSS